MSGATKEARRFNPMLDNMGHDRFYVLAEDYDALLAERDRLREYTLKAQEHALAMGDKALAATLMLIEVRGVVYQSHIDRCDPESAGKCLDRIDAALQGAQPCTP